MSVNDFQWEIPEVLEFPDKEVVTFEILKVDEWQASPEQFGIRVNTKIVVCEGKPEMVGKELPFNFQFKTINGKQNADAFYFLNAFFPEEMKKRIPLPFHFLPEQMFTAVSKRNKSQKDPTKVYQNWTGYKSLGSPGESGDGIPF